MNETEIHNLLAAVMAYDNRKPSVAMVTAWMEQSDRGRWTFHEALEAIHTHHSESTEWLMPAHITKLIKRERSKVPHVSEIRQIEAAPPAEPDRIGALVAEVAGRLGWKSRALGSEDAAALSVECPRCHASPKRPCARLVTRGPHRGEYRAMKQFHPSRVDLALRRDQ